NSRLRCGEADTKAHAARLEQFAMSIARAVLTGPIARAAFSGAHTEGDGQADDNRTRRHESLDARPLYTQQEMGLCDLLERAVHSIEIGVYRLALATFRLPR